MIPKIIHYCWFGGKPMGDLHVRCMESWKKVLPEYKLIRWDEHNSPMDHPYIRKAFGHRMYSRVSNFVRLHALYNFGGLYFDTDIEVVKPFDPLMTHKCFLSFQVKEKHKDWVNNAVMGAERRHPFLKRCQEYMVAKCLTDGVFYVQPELTTKVLVDMGLKEYGPQVIEDVHLYPVEYFFPFSWKEKFSPSCVTKDTYTIHYWDKSWWNTDDQPQKRSLIERVRRKLQKIIDDVQFKRFPVKFNSPIVRSVLWAYLPILAMSSLLHRLLWHDVKKPITEGVLCMLLLVLFFSFRPVQSFIAALPGGLKKTLALILFLMAFGQIANIPRVTFPFIGWTMFDTTVTKTKVKFFHYYGVTEDGGRVLIQPPILFPSLQSGRIITDTDTRMRFYLDGELDNDQKLLIGQSGSRLPQAKRILNGVRRFLDDEWETDYLKAPQGISSLMVAFGVVYNLRYPSTRIERVQVERGTIDLTAPSPEPAMETVLIVDLPKEMP